MCVCVCVCVCEYKKRDKIIYLKDMSIYIIYDNNIHDMIFIFIHDYLLYYE